MQPWKCIFDSQTLVGTGCNREPLQGETAVEIDATLCGWLNTTPGRYKLVNNIPVERQEWAAEQAAIEAEKAREAAIAAISAQRYSIETGGVMFGEYQLLTDRESQQILDSAIEKVRRGLVESIVWKCGNGKWLTIDDTNADVIEGLVLQHVQSAFAWEKAELEKLEE
jgi:hypothetical protein